MAQVGWRSWTESPANRNLQPSCDLREHPAMEGSGFLMCIDAGREENM